MFTLGKGIRKCCLFLQSIKLSRSFHKLIVLIKNNVCFITFYDLLDYNRNLLKLNSDRAFIVKEVINFL